MTTEDLKEIAAQLKTPTGENGIEMGKSMNETNIGMTMSAIESITIQKNHSLLELGHGNGGHVKHILEKAANVRYIGLEISEEMKNQAKKLNRLYTPDNIAIFELYDGLKIPFDNNSFDHVLSVNTIYFWEDARLLLNEISRILKPSGTFCLVFADKSFMLKLPFTQFGFQLYDIDKFKKLISISNFEIKDITNKEDQVMSKAGDLVIRKYYTITLGKLGQ